MREGLELAELPPLGFEQVLELPFTRHDKKSELFRVFAHREGLLLATDSYSWARVNRAKVWYNWRPPHDGKWWGEGLTSSGHMTAGNIWVGDHDARWSLASNMDRLRKHGQFLSTWTERPFLWLLHYMDTVPKDYDYKAINASRIALLPEWVQTMIGPEK